MSSERVRQEWDARVKTDPLLWMAEGVPEESSFRESGERDFASLVDGISPQWLKDATHLEIGCGVGRLLLPALACVKSVAGADISGLALEYAKKRCQDNPITLIALHSDNLSEIIGTFDLILSFAALVHLTPETLVKYLCRIRSLMANTGLARLQLYIGDERVFSQCDTFSIRSYDEARLSETLTEIGFTIEKILPVPLPFDGSDRTLNRIPVVFHLKKSDSRSIPSPIALLHLLCSKTPQPEETSFSRDEYGVVMREVNRHLHDHRLQEALVLLQFWEARYPHLFPEVRDAIGKIMVALKTVK